MLLNDITSSEIDQWPNINPIQRLDALICILQMNMPTYINFSFSKMVKDRHLRNVKYSFLLIFIKININLLRVIKSKSSVYIHNMHYSK